jgi:uncharacterized protein (TIGR03067 family)
MMMQRFTALICCLMLGPIVVPVLAQPAHEVDEDLQGTWTATTAERDGKAASDVVDHQLSITGTRFQLVSRDGKVLYAGTLRLDRRATPAAIDFLHSEGDLKGKVWKGIYALAGDTLTICDNAPNPEKDRPTAFKAGSGSGYIFVTFKRTRR